MFIQRVSKPFDVLWKSSVRRCVVDLDGEYINRTGFPTPAFLASGIILVVFICLDSFNQILRIKIYKYYAIHVCHIFCVLRAKDWCKQMHTRSKFPRPTSSLRSDCVQIEVVQRLCTDCTLPGKRPPSGSRCSGFWGRSASQVFS